MTKTTADNLFSQAAARLRDYAEIMDNCAMGGDDSWSADRDAALKICARLDELNGEWEQRVGFSDALNAAKIIASMLKDWRIPGSVWYAPWRGRFRLAGENYKPESKHEVCVGVYMPDAPESLLYEDIKFVMDGN